MCLFLSDLNSYWFAPSHIPPSQMSSSFDIVSQNDSKSMPIVPSLLEIIKKHSRRVGWDDICTGQGSTRCSGIGVEVELFY